MSADPLAAVADLEQRLGRVLTDVEAQRAPALLTDASAKVRRYCRQTFETVVDDVVVLRAEDGEIRLQQRPVTAVTTVVAVGGNGIPDIQIFNWFWDGIDIIRLGSGDYVINLPEVWWDDWGFPDTFRITYSHGAGVPDEAIAVTCSMVLRTLTTPTLAGGIKSETIGHYNYQLDQAGGGLTVTMTQAEKDELADFRRKAGSQRIRPGV